MRKNFCLRRRPQRGLLTNRGDIVDRQYHVNFAKEVPMFAPDTELWKISCCFQTLKNRPIRPIRGLLRKEKHAHGANQRKQQTREDKLDTPFKKSIVRTAEVVVPDQSLQNRPVPLLH